MLGIIYSSKETSNFEYQEKGRNAKLFENIYSDGA